MTGSTRRASRQGASEVTDQQFRRFDVLTVAAGIVDLRSFKGEAREGFTDAGRIVEREDEFPLYARQQPGKDGKILAGEYPLAVVAFAVPVRRIDIEYRFRLVVPFDDLMVRQAFHIRPGQPQMSGGKLLLDPEQVEFGRADGGIPECRACQPAAEARLLDVIEPGGALDIRQRIRLNALEPFKLVPRYQNPFEVADKLLQMMLDDAVKGDKLPVDVVDDLHPGFRFAEKHPCRSGKRLAVAGMGRKHLHDAVGKLTFAAHPSGERRTAVTGCHELAPKGRPAALNRGVKPAVR